MASQGEGPLLSHLKTMPVSPDLSSPDSPDHSPSPPSQHLDLINGRFQRAVPLGLSDESGLSDSGAGSVSSNQSPKAIPSTHGSLGEQSYTKTSPIPHSASGVNEEVRGRDRNRDRDRDGDGYGVHHRSPRTLLDDTVDTLDEVLGDMVHLDGLAVRDRDNPGKRSSRGRGGLTAENLSDEEFEIGARLAP